MVQAFLIMGVIISLPLILLVSTYQLKTVMTVTFALFTLHMLTFWWELARWVELQHARYLVQPSFGFQSSAVIAAHIRVYGWDCHGAGN